jgi:hypothetical protein
MPFTDAAGQVSLVLRHDEHRRAGKSRTGDDDAVVLVRRDPEPCEMRARTRRRKPCDAVRVGK